MNRIISFLLFITCSFSGTAVQAREQVITPSQQFGAENGVTQKIYVQPAEIYLKDNKIFVQTMKGFVEVPSIQSDYKGIYYQTAHPNSWVCPHCNEYNVNTYYCEQCGRAPEGK
jgi:hypothetical protein